MIFIMFPFLIFGDWYVCVKIRGTDMVKVKFDYTTKKTSRISTWKIIAAVLFLMLIFILAFTSDSMQTSAGRKVNFLIVGIVVCIYIAVILFFNIQRIKIKKSPFHWSRQTGKGKHKQTIILGSWYDSHQINLWFPFRENIALFIVS